MASVDIVRSFSGAKYMCDALVDAGVEVDVWTRLPATILDDTSEWRFTVHSFKSSWYHRISPLRSVGRKLHELFLCITAKDAVIFVNDESVPPVVAAKRLRPGLKIINYSTDLFLEEEFDDHKARLKSYRKILPKVDLIIDDEEHRAAARRDHFGYDKDILILPSTLPASTVPESSNTTLEALAGREFPADTPVLIYAGCAHPFMSFDKVIDAVKLAGAPVFLLAFCHGSDAQVIEQWRNMAMERLGPDGAAICNSVPREDLISCLHHAHMGLVYYPYSDCPSINQLYCAPTKAYEYIAAGLPVVTSANPSMVSLIEERGLGACAKDDSPEALAEAIRTVMSMNTDNARERAKQIFRDELCFEKQAPPVINRLLEELGHQARDN